MGEENSTDPPIEPTESASALPQEAPTESMEAAGTDASVEAAPTEAAVPAESPAEPEAVIGEPLETEEPAVDPEPAVTDATPEQGPAETPAAPEPTDAPAASQVASGDPSIETDKANYGPGETVVVSGAGWTPGEQVTLRLRDLDWADTLGVREVTVAPSGEFEASIVLPDINIVELRLSATSDSGRVAEGFSALVGSL